MFHVKPRHQSKYSAAHPSAAYLAGVQVVPNDAAKMPWLKAQLPAFIDAGDVLVFANQKARVDNVCQELLAGGFRQGESQFSKAAAISCLSKRRMHASLLLSLLPLR